MTSTASVTVQAGPHNIVHVPFNSQQVANNAQSAINAMNVISSMGFVQTFSVPNTEGDVTVPVPSFIGAVMDTVPANVNLGILDARNFLLTNAGTGTLTAIGGPNTTVVSGSGGSVSYTNNSSAGAVFLGGGNNWVGNWAAGNNMVVDVDGGQTLFSTSTVVDASKGASTINVFQNGLIQVTGGADATGTVNVSVQGTAGVFVGGSSTVAATVTGGAGSTIYYGGNGTAGSAGSFINPGAGNVAIFPGMTGSATLFGGSRPFGTAAEFTGAATVFGGNGYFEGGRNGFNVLQTSSVAGAATLIGGGDHDFIDAQGSHDLIHTGNGQGVIVYTDASITGGDTYVTGSGSGLIIGGQGGHNDFFLGSGNYTIAGYHDLSQGARDGIGSIYQDLATSAGGGNGNITIVDFVPQVSNANGTITFDKFMLNDLTATIGQAGGSSIAHLSDGTTVTFQGSANVQNHGSYLA